MSRLGDFFRARRMERRSSTGELARLAGYGSLSQGSNRIHAFKPGGKVAPDLLAKLASALETWGGVGHVPASGRSWQVA